MPRPFAHLSLITRVPSPGTSKTRLIPVLGDEGAAELQREMGAHVALQLRILAATRDASVDAFVDGTPPSTARAWLGIPVRAQAPGDLGARLEHALTTGLARARVAGVVGGDCPTLDAEDMRAALFAAQARGAAIVPAEDGGFCLLALAREYAAAVPAILEGVEWGSSLACGQLLDGLRSAGADVAVMPQRSDVDTSADLPAWEAVQRQWSAVPGSLAVVIPVLNEAQLLPPLLQRVLAEADEVIVADGGSEDDSVGVARDAAARVVCANRGRGAQMNAGAAEASADALLFLHADSLPEPGFRDVALAALATPGVLLGAYEFSLDATTRTLRAMQLGTNLRARHLRLPYGDQGLFLRKAAFRALGGFADVPVLEDLLLVEAARRARGVAIAPMRLLTSDRRWREYGTWRWSALNLATLARHRLGASPAQLDAWRSQLRARYSNR